MRNEHAFTHWMQHQHGLSERTSLSRLSNCRRVEVYEGDLDAHYATDSCSELLKRLSYSRDEANLGRRVQHRIPIDGDQYNGTATLRSAVQLFVAFHRSQGPRTASAAPASGSGTQDRPLKSPVSAQSRVSRTAGSAAWPTWETPGTEEILSLARTTTPYLRFLHPDIVQAIVEDTERHREAWSAALQQRGIDPAHYLWYRGACGFPGIRRYAGSSEIAMHRKRMAQATAPLAGALKTDDNTFPKHTWSFILRGRPFQNFGPNDYQLAHLLDHKDDKPSLARLNQEIVRPDQQSLDVTPHGLFTSVANTVYIPKALIRPTDFTQSLRTLIQRRAQHLYGAVCNLVPPPWTIRNNLDPAWSLDAFGWAEPVGSLRYLKQFLAFRHEQIERLFG